MTPNSSAKDLGKSIPNVLNTMYFLLDPKRVPFHSTITPFTHIKLIFLFPWGIWYVWYNGKF